MDLGLAPCVEPGVNIKPSDALKFLGALALAVLVLGLVALRVATHQAAPGAVSVAQSAMAAPPPPPAPTPTAPANCSAAGWDAAARANGASLRTLAWSPRGDRLASGGWDKLAKIWDPGRGVELQRLTGCAANRDSQHRLTGGQHAADHHE